MANFEERFRTNRFHVLNKYPFEEMLAHLRANDLNIQSTIDDAGRKLYQISGYSSLLWENSDEGDNETVDCFDEKQSRFVSVLQAVLPQDEAMIYLENWHEKLRTVGGRAVVVTRNSVDHLDLETWAERIAEERIGPQFVTY